MRAADGDLSEAFKWPNNENKTALTANAASHAIQAFEVSTQRTP